MTEGRDTDERDGAISRWSRLKQREKQERDRAGGAPGGIAEPAGEGGELVPGHGPDQAAIVEQLPDIETLEETSDFTVFLKEGVPEALRRQALRKLWRLNPVFANLDGLNDYDEDFTIVTTLAENIKTLYQVGKGMPDPEPVEEPEDDAEQPFDEAEIAEPEPSLDTGEPEAESAETESDGDAPALSELPLAAAPMDRAAEPEPVRTADGGRQPVSSAARRRWAGFTS